VASKSFGQNPNKGGEGKGQRRVAPRRFKPELHIFNVTNACLCLSVAFTYEKSVIAANKHELSREVFNKLGFRSCS